MSELSNRTQKGRILAVDDSPADLHFLKKILTEQGYTVHLTSEGELALRFVQTTLPDIILLDIHMRGLNGYEVCERLKANEATQDIPIIFISGEEQVLDKVQTFSKRGVDYIVKPFQAEEVIRRIEMHLSLRHLQKDLEERVLFLAKMKEQLAEQNLLLQQEVAIRRSTEAALHLRNRAVEACLNAIVIINCRKPGNPIEYVNSAFKRITGYEPEDAIERGIDFLSEQDKEQYELVELKTLLQEGREGQVTLRSYRKDGTMFWNELHIAPVRDDTGQATHIVCVMNDITEQKRYQEVLKRLGNYDSLTALPNRNLLFDRLGQAIHMARRLNYPVGVVFIDLDRFKFINDTLGHDAGDELLITIAKRLIASVRKSDTVARLGGDEFVLVLPDSAQALPVATLVERPKDASSYMPLKTVVERIVKAVAEPILLKGEQYNITCSIGVSFFPKDGEEAEVLLKKADAAMYRVKDSGRNNFQFFEK